MREIVSKLKASHEKFADPDFGPSEADEFGALSLYGGGAPNPAGSKYPAPESLRWERPQYDDGKLGGAGEEQEEEEDVEQEEDDEFAMFAGGDDDEVRLLLLCSERV